MDEDHTRVAWPSHLYNNIYFIPERYEYVEMSRQRVDPTRFPPTLRHKAFFAYECRLKRAITQRCMHVHAVLSSCKARQLSTTEERMPRWLHRPDVEAAL